MNHADRIENLPRFHPSRQTRFTYAGDYSSLNIAVEANWIRGDAVWSEKEKQQWVRLPLWLNKDEVIANLQVAGIHNLKGFSEAWKAFDNWLNPPLPGTVPRKRTRLERYVRSVWRALKAWRYV